MTDFIYEEYDEIHIRDIINADLDDFIAMMSYTEAGLAYWADGVLFACFAMTDSDTLAKKEIAGVTYIDKVIFAKYPKFTRTVKSAANFEIPAVNVSRSRLYSKLISWLKTHPAWQD